MSSRGWIKLHRKIQDHWIYQEKRQFSRYEAWLDLIMMANHKENKTLIDGELKTIEKGSFITSKRELGRRWDWSNSKVDKFLILLEQDEMITHKSDTKKTVVTIGKYDVYHELEKEKRNENETETKQKHIKNETETNKQELKELKNLRTKELKDSTTTAAVEKVDAIHFYQNNIGIIRPIIAEELLDWIKDFGDGMVIESLSRSIDAGKPNWGYAKAILKAWHEKGIKTIEQANAEAVEFKNQQSLKRPFYQNNQTKDETPEWFERGDHLKKQEDNSAPEQTAAEQQRLAKLMQQYAAE